ncbi:uncharacterized protein LOC105649769 isoform X2 [Jatropha curcas]|uniref:uncharacterized protein LOC105649769 isoform X2 n=1 Tax=Jatropha curcas TaxID=180498 RepID=UPI0005FC13E5|nr:uncharacterized protein LOC105649769 isoform X2 [Jatropha curcas]
MAMQTGMSLSKIIVLAGAGYTGTVLFQNGKLSDLIGELQLMVKGWEKSKEHLDGDSDYSDAIAQQVKRLSMEVRQLASARQITVLNGNSGQMGNVTGLIVPAAAVGALGYGYMWWKGLKFSDLMYVTKRNMANAVSNLTKHLEQVTEALSAAKKHLTQRIQHLDDKMENQKELSRDIQIKVDEASTNIANIGSDLWQLQCLVSGLDDKIGSLEEKQDVANAGVIYLCNYVSGQKTKMPKALEDQLKHSGKTHLLPHTLGFKALADDLSRTFSEPASNVMLLDGIDKLEDPLQTPHIDQPRPMHRFNSAKC